MLSELQKVRGNKSFRDTVANLLELSAYFSLFNYGSGNIVTFTGTYSAPVHQGSGSVLEIIGMQAKPFVHSGTVTAVYGERSGFNIDGGTVTDANAVYVEPMIEGTTAISGALTGVNITSSNITAGLAANAYGLYIEDYSGKATTNS
jgi:hypothetical protein